MNPNIASEHFAAGKESVPFYILCSFVTLPSRGIKNKKLSQIQMKILFTLRKPPVATATVHCPHVYRNCMYII